MAATELYTRGAPGDADNRGESLVQQHLDRMQQQKEAVAMEKLRVLMPQLGDMVRALALAKSDWDLDKAVNMLRSFQVAHLDKVNVMNKKRKKIREEIEAYHSGDEQDKAQADKGGDGGKAAGRSGASSSGSSGSSSSDSGSDDDGGGGRKSKRQRSGSRERKERSSSKRSKKKGKRSSRDKDSKAKRRSKDKQEKRSSRDKDRKRRRADKDTGGGSDDEAAARNKLTHSEDFGKYGYIREADMHAKQNEFVVWATEVKGANVELMGRAEEKELFREYMEDYNTGTLPHKKYYDLVAYERYAAAKAAHDAAAGAGKGSRGKDVGAAGFDARADEEAMRRARMDARLKEQQDRLAEAYNLLKHTDRAKDMREQELLRAEMALAYKTGDRARADKIFNRLQPDEPTKKK